MLRSAWVDVIAILVFGALGIANKLTGHEAAACMLLVVVGRLRPPASSSGNEPPPTGGVATVLLFVVSLVLHPGRELLESFGIGIEKSHGQEER